MRRSNHNTTPWEEHQGMSPLLTITELGPRTHWIFAWWQMTNDKTIMVKCLAQGHKCRDQERNLHSDNHNFSWSCLSRKIAEHNQFTLTRIRLPAKVPNQVFNFWLVTCSNLLSKNLLSIFFCLSSSLKLGPELKTGPLGHNILKVSQNYIFVYFQVI